MRKFYLLTLLLLSFASLSAQCSDLFFSEYIEGSGNNKAYEIYNPTNNTVDLADYVVYRYGNGSATASDSLQLQGMLAPGAVYVVANPSADTAITNVADVTSTTTFFNGDDALSLNNTMTGDTLDIIGVVGQDPGTNWSVTGGATSEFTLVRQFAITEGSTDWSAVSNQWDVSPQNTFSFIGSHTADACATAPVGGNCPTDLFFSEYIEGSSSNKALEIYNPTADTVDLTDYVIYRYNNGAVNPSDSLFPQGTLAPDEVFIIGNPSAVPGITNVSDTTHTMTFFNGDDAILLYNNMTGDSLDVIGEIGVDPGSGWTVGSGATNNFTLVRQISIQEGTTDWSVGATQWDIFPIDTFDSLDAHTMVPCTPVVGGPGCTDDLFFSEYIEGLTSNKALEIYNPMDTTVDLSSYVLYRFNNGASTPTDSLFPQGNLASGDVFVIGNPSANATIAAATDTTHSLALFNGDDALAMINLMTGDTLDIIGVVGEDPGTNWVVGMGATSEFTLVRQFNIRQGETNWANASMQWDVFPQDFADSLGMHSMNPCGNASTVTEIAIVGMTNSVNEPAGSVTIEFSIAAGTSVSPTDSSVADLVLTGGSATQGTDFTFANTPVTFPYNQSMVSITIPIIDDQIFEGNETFSLALQNVTNGALITNSSQTVTIVDDELPTYPIGTINTVDTNGVGDSLGLTCFIEGVVYGVDMRGGGGIQFTVIDPTGGIGVFSFNDVSNYAVLEGDSIRLRGSVTQFNGLLQMSPDSILLVSSGNTLKMPSTVTQLGEGTESDLVRFENATLVDPNQWNGGGSFNVDVTNGTDTIVVRIDSDVDISGLPAPAGPFTVCGLGGQFDSSNPFTSGYQLLPRYTMDIKPIVQVELGADTAFCGGSVVLDAGNPGYQYLWSNGDTAQTITATVAGTYSVTVTEPTYGGTSSDTIQIDPGAAPVAAFGLDTIFSNAFTFLDSSSANPTSWAWTFGDGGTSTQQNPTHTYVANGVYTVTLVATNACGSDTTTFEIDLLNTNIEEVLGNLEIYPNPTEGRFSVRLPEGRVEPVLMRVYDLYGQTVLTEELDGAVNQFELNGLARGIYFVETTYLGATGTSKLVLR